MVVHEFLEILEIQIEKKWISILGRGGFGIVHSSMVRLRLS